MTSSFMTVVLIILAIQIAMLCSFIRVEIVAKAGKVTKFHWKYKILTGKRPKSIMCGDRPVDVSGYKALYVYGNSMKDYDIHNGQEVFVKELDERAKEKIRDFPVLAFHIYNTLCQSPYKLRKFVSYIDLGHVDWERVYREFHQRIRVPKAQFIEECEEKQDKERQNKVSRYILSETYDEDLGTYHYSLHPVSSLYGIVKYVI